VIKPIRNAHIAKSVFVIPTTGYGALFLCFVIFALKEGIPTLALAGLGSMFPITAINLVLFMRWLRRSRSGHLLS